MSSEFWQDALFDIHPDPMWIFDRRSLRFLRVNRRAEALFGYSGDEFRSMRITDLRAADAAQAVVQAVAHAGPDDTHAGVWQLHCRSGRVVHADVRWQALQHEGQDAMLASIRDVTQVIERERAAHAERQVQDASLRMAERLLGIGIWHMDPASGALDWSPNTYRIFGTTPARFGHSIDGYLALVHPEDREQMRRRFEEFSPVTTALLSFAHRILHPDGRLVHVRGAAEVEYTSRGPALTGVIQDVTEQTEADLRLVEASSLVRLAGQAARVGGWRVTVSPATVTWTSQTCRIHEVPDGTSPSLEDAIAYYAPEYRSQIEADLSECMESGTPFDEVLQILTARGKRVWVRSIGEAERNSDGAIVAIRGAIQDISDLAEAQQRSESLSEQLRATLEQISDAFFTLDDQWRFTFVNGQAERVLFRDREDLLGRDVWHAFPEAVGSAFESEYRHALQDQRTRRFVEYFPPLAAWFEVNVYPANRGLAVYFRDVTAERARAEQLRLLETAVSRQNDILLITEAEPIDGPEGPRIVYVNDAFVQKTGYTRDEVIGRTPRMLQGPKTDRGELQRIRTALENWQPVRAELINYTKSGDEFWLELDIVPLADDRGWYTHWVSVERDITQRKLDEQALMISDERFRLVAKATKDTVWDWDLTRGTVWWSEGINDQFGYDAHALEPGPESWINRIHPEDKVRVLQGIQTVIKGGGANWSDEYRFLHAHGEAITVSNRGFVIRNEAGEVVRMLGSMDDVTDRRAQDERLRQSQKLEAVGQLTGGVAHDFNNLLTVILGNSELLSRRLTGQQQLRLLADMTATAAERGAELTNRLLAFGRRQALQPKLVDLNRLISGIEGMLRRTLSEDIDIEMIQSGGLWLAEVDPGQVEVALLNLAINARDAMPGGGRLTIETANSNLDDSYAGRHEEVTAGQYVMVSISDTGTGMPADVVARAFEPFFTTKDVGKGSGLGLSMVYGFVKQSDGHAKIYSEVGLGTSVKLYFPRAKQDERELDAVSEERQAVGGDEHILVVEDDPLVREHLIAQLEALGYRVTGANTGPQALEAIKQLTDIDLLFTDVVMPGGMNGRELAAVAQRLRPDLKVLYTSGYTENAIVHHGRLDRGIHLLSKPYRRQELAAKVRRVIDE